MGKETAGKAAGQKDYDTQEKELEDYPDVFADIINALIYQGEQKVRPEHLRQAVTETRYRDATGALRKQIEDLGKYEEVDGEAKTLFLLANQTVSDEHMILRKCGYTGGYYRGQYKGQTRDICPVLELVLYWGEEPWKGKTGIREFFHEKALSDRLWEFIDDEKLHVFEMRRLPREVIDRFTGDMRILLECLSGNADGKYMEWRIKHVEAFLELMQVLTGDSNYRKLAEDLQNKNSGNEEEGGGCNMGDLIGDAWREGIQQGVRQGLIAACKEFGATFEETAQKLKEKFSLTDEEAEKEMQLYW